MTVSNLYVMDASTDPAGAPRTDFYCGNPIVVLNFTNLPPAKYALAMFTPRAYRSRSRSQWFCPQRPTVTGCWPDFSAIP